MARSGGADWYRNPETAKRWPGAAVAAHFVGMDRTLSRRRGCIGALSSSTASIVLPRSKRKRNRNRKSKSKIKRKRKRMGR
jgi:hypothetical protein